MYPNKYSYTMKNVYLRDGKLCNQFDKPLMAAVMVKAQKIACSGPGISEVAWAMAWECVRQDCSEADLLFQAMVDYCVKIIQKRYGYMTPES